MSIATFKNHQHYPSEIITYLLIVNTSRISTIIKLRPQDTLNMNIPDWVLDPFANHRKQGIKN